MTPRDRIATRFNIDPAAITYRRGRGWFYRDRFLHRSLYELQHTPAWSLMDITNLWIADRDRDQILVRMTSEEFGHDDHYCDTIEDALRLIQRLCFSAADLDDGVERLIGIVVNKEPD